MFEYLNHDYLQHLLNAYGGVGLFILLALGIFGLPIPDETLLVLSGFLMAKGNLSLIATPIFAFAGSCLGITMSYVLGYFAGKGFLQKYGAKVGLNDKKLERAHLWFEKYGKWTLLIGYYIPGVRHLTGFIAGTVYLTWWEFMLFAYTGAFIWSMTFMTIGYFFYDVWHKYLTAYFA